MYDQPASYSYLSYKLNVFSWLDNIAIPSHAISNAVEYEIVPNDSSNSIDHLPVPLTVKVQ